MGKCELLYESENHKVCIFTSMMPDETIQTNQYLVVHKDSAILIDPGGYTIFSPLFAEVSSKVPLKDLKYIFFSHQDPDIVSGMNGWLLSTNAQLIIPKLWTRFIGHIGLKKGYEKRIIAVDDRGGTIELGDIELRILPAHFMHSPGNFQIYDPVSKILFSGDVGASVGQNYLYVEDFENHKKLIEGFHRRYMANNKICKLWANMVKKLDIDIIAPQHGALFKGKENVNAFIDWISNLQCGTDIMDEIFNQ